MSTAPTRSMQEGEILVLDGSATLSENSYLGFHVEGDTQQALSSVESWRYRLVKRAFDLTGAFFMALVFLIPGILIVVAIRLTSSGSVFYREERIGRDGLVFKIWKFRSMHQHAPRQSRTSDASQNGNLLEWRMQKHLKDPRITTVGAFLRRWSLDEVPQLINVLRGEMSLVGPRPIVKQETTFYGEYMRHYLAVTPGMSGLWQVSGRSQVDYNKRVLMDAFYVESWSLFFDFGIMLRTIPAVLGRKGAA